jgi:hypothetical protein
MLSAKYGVQYDRGDRLIPKYGAGVGPRYGSVDNVAIGQRGCQRLADRYVVVNHEDVEAFSG